MKINIQTISRKFKAYYYLTKPGILYSNVLMAMAGYLLGCRWQADISLLIGLTVGIGLIIGSACVFNNYIDRGIDAKMARTKKRALVTGMIGIRASLIYGAILGSAGFTILILHTTNLVTLLGLIAFVDYVIFYGIAKRKSVYGTLVGTISGGASLVAGYTAASGKLNLTALLLFLLMVGWQMPHFYAIAIRRLADYKKAGLAVMPAVKGLNRTKIEMVLYCSLFILCLMLLAVRETTGWFFLVIMLPLAFRWLQLCLLGFRAPDSILWAKQVFLFSLIIITVLPVALALGPILP